MYGATHAWVAEQARALLPERFRSYLQKEWEWLEGAVVLPDSHLRYDTSDADDLSPGYKTSYPVHRYDCDAVVPHNYGLVGQALRYYEGPLNFIKDCSSDAADDPDYYYGQIALYLGMLCHFVGDLCTPVHVGCQLDAELKDALGSRFHQRIERRLARIAKHVQIHPTGPISAQEIHRSFFESTACDFAYPIYTQLPRLLTDAHALDKELVRILERSVQDTAVAWISLLVTSEFRPREE